MFLSSHGRARLSGSDTMHGGMLRGRVAPEKRTKECKKSCKSEKARQKQANAGGWSAAEEWGSEAGCRAGLLQVGFGCRHWNPWFLFAIARFYSGFRPKVGWPASLAPRPAASHQAPLLQGQRSEVAGGENRETTKCTTTSFGKGIRRTSYVKSTQSREKCMHGPPSLADLPGTETP